MALSQNASHVGDAGSFPRGGELGGEETAPQEGNVVPQGGRVFEKGYPVEEPPPLILGGCTFRSSQKAV